MAINRSIYKITNAYELWKNNKQLMEPQRNNNFEVVIYNIDDKEITNRTNAITRRSKDYKDLTLSVAQFTAPSMSIGTLPISYGNNKMKFAGLPEYSDCQMTVNDYIGIDVENVITDWSNKVYNPKTGKIGFAFQYKKDAILYEYSPNYETVRKWRIYGLWPSNFNLGDFNQEGGNVRQLSMNLVYDYCEPMDDNETNNKFNDTKNLLGDTEETKTE